MRLTSKLTFEVLKMNILERIPLAKVSSSAHLVWLDNSIADMIALETIQLINESYYRNFLFFNGVSSKRIIAGLFYLLGYRYKVIKSQNEIADKLNTSDATIRKSYQKWLHTFPESFLDIKSNFETNKELKNSQTSLIETIMKIKKKGL